MVGWARCWSFTGPVIQIGLNGVGFGHAVRAVSWRAKGSRVEPQQWQCHIWASWLPTHDNKIIVFCGQKGVMTIIVMKLSNKNPLIILKKKIIIISWFL
jgi:hypothetical protein